MSDYDLDFFFTYYLDTIEEDKQKEFLRDTIHLVLRWNILHTIAYEYLSSFDTLLVKVKAKLISIQNNGINHC